MSNLKKALKKIPLVTPTYRKLVYFHRNRKTGKYNNNPRLLGKISPNDDMFFLDENVEHYISVGESALKNIEEALKLGNKTFNDLNSVLDVPCGHGRVLRHLVKKISPENITACEIIPDAVNFCMKEFKVKGFVSSDDFNKLKFPAKYDLIWVGSLFTHLREDYFIKLLEVLIDSLNKEGILVFTTHGSHSFDILDSYGVQYENIQAVENDLKRTNGFCFFPQEGSSYFGISISLHGYVTRLLKDKFKDKVKLLMYNHRGWDNHQDVFAVQKL